MTRAVLGSLAFAAILTTGSFAHAQAMPDPRQMSGIPRPDEKVDPGLLTAMVIHGELGAKAAIGTPVHLVAVKPDGTISSTLAKVNDEGRAEFPGLARDGATAYYALALFGDDRLASDVIVMPPQIGVRLMLAGRKLDKQGAPIGPPIDDERREGNDPAIPAGVVEVQLRGHVAPKMKVRLRDLAHPEAAPIEVEASGNDDVVCARFTDVPVGPDHVYAAEATAFARPFRTSPFMMSTAAGVKRGILVHDKLLFGVQGGAQIDDENLWFEMQLALANATGAPYDTGPAGQLIPLPDGFASPQISGDNPGAHWQLNPKGIVWMGLVPPGQRDVVVQFSLPIENGHVHLSMPAPLGIFESQLAFEHIAGVSIVPGASTKTTPKPMKTDDARQFDMLSEIVVNPGDNLVIDVSGLPQRTRGPIYAALVAGLVVLGLLGCGAVGAP